MSFKTHPVVAKALASNIPEHLILIHGKLYDPASIDHPGGNAWLMTCKGVDATALFESSHINIHAARAMLERLSPVAVFATPDNAPLTDYTRYACLREIVYKKFPTRSMRRAGRATRLAYALCVLTVASSHIYLLRTIPFSFQWIVCCFLSAVVNTVWGGMGHNFVHQLDSRAIALDWNGLSSYEWMLEHVISHHPSPNTHKDHDSISMLPLVDWTTRGAAVNRARILLRLFLFAVVLFVGEISVAIQGNFGHRCRWKVPDGVPLWMKLAPYVFVLRCASVILFHGSVPGVMTLFVSLSIASVYFSYLAHLNHAVGSGYARDFVEQQLNNTVDMKPARPFTLGLDKQTIHHLFPTLDHSRIDCSLRTAIACEIDAKESFQKHSIRHLSNIMYCRVVKLY